MDKKYKHRINFRLEQRKSKTEKVPTEIAILADITFNCKRIWYHSGFRIAPSKWEESVQRVKRNNFNEDGVSSTDINKRLVEIETAVHAVFDQLDLKQIEPTPVTVREELKRLLNDEKSTRLTVAEVYQLIIDERKKELAESPDTASWARGTLKKHITLLAHIKDFRAGIYFEDISVEWLNDFELFLVKKGLTNSYVYKSMVDMRTFLNIATKRGFNHNHAYVGYKQRFKDETKNDKTVNLYALNDEELLAVMTFPTNRACISRCRDMFVFSCFTGMRFSEMINLRWSNVINGDILDIVAQKTNKRQRFALAMAAQSILQKYPRCPDEEDPLVFPRISNQKYNDHLKEVGRLAGLTGDWITEKQIGRKKIREVKPKYQLFTSHVGRRTFVSMCMRKHMTPEMIKAVTGHGTTAMMMKYVYFDDDSKREEMGILNGDGPNGQFTIFDAEITESERTSLGLPEKDAYFEMFEGDIVSANAHLAMLFHLRGDEDNRATYMKRLPNDRFNEVLKMITS